MRKRNLSVIALCSSCKKAGFCRGIEIEFFIDTVHEIKPFDIKEYFPLVPLRANDYRYSHFTRKYIQIAFDAFHQEDYETALLNFRVVEKECQGYIEVLIGLSLSYLMLNDYANAIYFMERCISISYRPSQLLLDFIVEVGRVHDSISSVGIEYKEAVLNSNKLEVNKEVLYIE